MSKKRRTLPKDFDDLLSAGDLQSLKAVFDRCELDAYGGYAKQSALAFDTCPDELARWLVEQGADLNRLDDYGNSPLHQRAGSWRGSIKVLLELGADVALNTERSGTPLHVAAQRPNPENVRLLLVYGASVHSEDADGLTPLESALKNCTNATIEGVAELSTLLLDSGATITSRMSGFVQSIGERFEFHREGFNKDSVDSTSDALDKLYRLFDTPPVPRRVLHDGKSDIVGIGDTWQEKNADLWERLVPSSGHAATVQGEVIRIAGRISDEIERNGGANWDRDYNMMAEAYLVHVRTGHSLSIEEIERARVVLSSVDNMDSQCDLLAELAVKWVSQNSAPVALPNPDYTR